MSAFKVAIAAHKGGTGKTVSAISLSSALARAGKRTLLIDLDPQGHSGVGLGVELTDHSPTIVDLLVEPARQISEVIHQTSVPKLAIIPSSIRLAWLAESLSGRPKREEILLRRLQPIHSTFEFLIMDCPPSLGVLTQNAIAAADFVLVPCVLEARAQDALVDLLELVKLLRGDDFDEWAVVLTKSDQRKTVTNEAIMAALKPWESRILKTSIPLSEPLNQAQIARTDIFAHDPKSKGALAYEALASELLSSTWQVHKKESPTQAYGTV